VARLVNALRRFRPFFLPRKYESNLIPVDRVSAASDTGDDWVATDPNPRFEWTSSPSAGNVTIRFSSSLDGDERVWLRVDYGRGLHYTTEVLANGRDNALTRHEAHIRFWLPPANLFLELEKATGPLNLSKLSMTRPSTVQTILRRAGNYLSGLRGGTSAPPTLTEVSARPTEELERFSSKMDALESFPSFSIRFPIDDATLEQVAAAVRSVAEQLYPFWELRVETEVSTPVDIRRFVEKHARTEPRIRMFSTATVSGALTLEDPMPPMALYEIAASRETPEKPERVREQSDPVCSIILVSFNAAADTMECLRSLTRLAPTISHEIIVMDNASTDETRRSLEHSAVVVRTIDNSENLGRAQACNRGAEIANGRYLLFLNNDTVVPGDLLERIVAAARGSDRIGAVGAKLVHPNGRLQEAGSILWSDGTALGYGRGDDPNEDEYSFRREVDFASAACLLVSREVFREVGGFDRDYGHAHYEDVDLCLKLRRAGYSVIYDPFSVVEHKEFGSTDRHQAVRLMQRSREKLVEKWSAELNHQPVANFASKSSVLRARSRGVIGSVGVFDERLPTRDQGAGYPRMYRLIACLRELGYQVSVSNLIETPSDEVHGHKLRQLGVEVVGPAHLTRWLALHGGSFDIVIVSRPNVFAARHALVRKYAPQATLVYDSEALWHRRVDMEAQLESYPLVDYPGAPTRASLSRESRRLRRLEQGAIKASDAVIAVSDDETRHIAKVNPRAPIFTIPTFHDRLRYGPDARAFDSRKDILLVGGFFNNPRSPNVDSVLYFLMEVLPRIQKEIPQVKLNIAGNAPPDMLRELAGNDVSIYGDARLEQLRALYFQARVCVVPQRFGSGVKSKVTEAMSLGLPLVVTRVGAEGTGLVDGDSAFIEDDPTAFADKVILLYTRPKIWNRMARRAYTIAIDQFSRSALLPRIQTMVEAMGPDRCRP
jgi:GT2 family glycosyltransferase/glycosyltransferase involved in cell wall biosynthesis